MASIVNNRAIRETRDRAQRGGKNLVYGIGDIDHELALKIHHRIYDRALSPDRKASITAKEMRDFMDRMVELPGEESWDKILSHASWKPRGLMARQRWAPNEDPNPPYEIRGLIDVFNVQRAKEHLLPYLPGEAVPVDLKQYLIAQLMTKGTLANRPSGGRTAKSEKAQLEKQKPFRERNKYFGLLNPEEISYARRKFKEGQELLDHGSNWIRYFASKGLAIITEVDETHVKGYIGWRRKFRKRKNWTGDVSDRIIRAELRYFWHLCKYAMYKRLISRNPADDVRIPRHRSVQVKYEKANEPLLLDEIKNALVTIRDRVAAHTDLKKKVDARLNYFTLLFLFLTGCRPKEAGQFSHDSTFLYFHRRNLAGAQGGKTAHAARKIRLTPVLKKILSDGILEKNRLSIDICARVHQYLERCDLNFSPYRIRHTVSTIRFRIEGENAAQIAYELGHSNPGFTYQKYTNLDAYSGYDPAEIKAFWTWLHNKAA